MRRNCRAGCGLLIAVFLVFPGCSSGPPHRTVVLGEAFVGPASLTLRRELGPRSPEAATVKHGDRVEIIGRRRRFVKVRTSKGVEGWTEMRNLLSTSQMEALNRLAERAARLPSHGAATVYEPLNVHTEPNRQAPSFHQIREGERVDVIEQRLAPRTPFQNPSLLPATKPEPQKVARKPKRTPEYPLPPMPPAPKPPDNWLELSKTPPLETPADEKKPPAKPVPVDTWVLVRLANGRAGWVLGRMLRMDIPDEVAQYSEGHRITSYFSMGTVNDGGVIKHHWLWTTSVPGNHDYDFDSFRYFVWNLRKHRYETAYVERNLRGFFPVSVHPVQVTVGNKTQTMPGFSLVVEEADGVRYRRTYAYQVYLVRLIGKEKWEPPRQEEEQPSSPVLSKAEPAPQSEPTLLGRITRNVKRWLRL